MKLSLDQQHQQAIQLINQRNYAQAHPLLVSLVRQAPQFADGWFLLGVINLELGQAEKAAALIEKAQSLTAKQEYQAQLVKAYALARDRARVTAIVNTIAPAQIDQGLTADTLGVALSTVGLHEEALPFYQRALTLSNTNHSFHYNFGIACKFLGRFQEAEQAFEQAITLSPGYVKAHYALSDLNVSAKPEERIQRLNQLMDKTPRADDRLHVSHALAKEYEAKDDFDSAFRTLETGKQQFSKQLNYNKQAEQTLFSALTEQHQAHQQIQFEGCSDPRPIFIVGMPRSGTTLMERILTAHTDVVSGEELHDFGIAVKELTGSKSRRLLDADILKAAYQIPPKQLGERYLERTRLVAGDARHFVDKLPFNFFYLDLIRRALPEARILCMLRDPMDTCVGNFRQLFSLSNPFTAYALDLNDTAHFYRQFYQWVTYFDKQAVERFRLVNYEALTRHPDQQVREIIDFCGLPWQDACLHVEQNTAPVSTASKVQVRKPINTRSIGRWKRYRPHTDQLQALFDKSGTPYDKTN